MDKILEGSGTGKVRRIALMGGTFDPIHYGHLVTAESVREKFGFDTVMFIPSGNPPHKRRISVSSPVHRYNMVQMAVASNRYFTVSRVEIDREGSTYTIDTIRELKSLLRNDADIYFITGADAILEVLTWKDPNELLSMCKFIAVTRPGYDKGALIQKVQELKALYNCDITIMDVPSFDISSSDIRQKVARCQSIKYLVPENVEQYIYMNNLYST